MTKFTGTELDMENVKIVDLALCTVGSDAANKTYVDSVAGGGGTYVAGDGLTDSPANTFNVANTDGNLVVSANSVDFSAGAAAVIAAGPAIGTVRTYSQVIGNGSATDFTITHNLSNATPLTQVMLGSTKELVGVKVVNTDANNVTVTFNVAPATNAYTAIVQG
jgi:hypothetical protein